MSTQGQSHGHDKVGIIACSFGQHVGDGMIGVSNEGVGSVALAIQQATGGVIAAQWEVAAFLASIDQPADYVIEDYGGDKYYLSTKDVLLDSLRAFNSSGITTVIVVAQPMHLKAIRLMLPVWHISGDTTFLWRRPYLDMVRQIPFDRSPGNRQWWTKGPIRFALYLARAGLVGTHGA